MNGSVVIAKIAGTEFDREDHVGNLDHHEGEKQRRDEKRATPRSVRLAHKEAVLVQALRHVEMATRETEDRVGTNVLLLLLHNEHLDARKDQEARKDVEHPVEAGDEGRADTYHDRAEHDHAKDAPEEHPVLIEPRDGEIGKDHGDDEDVVHRERLLDREAGHVGETRLLPQCPPYPAAEGDPERDVERGKTKAFSDADLVGVAMQDAEVEHEERQHQPKEAEPHPGGRAEQVGRQKGEIQGLDLQPAHDVER